MIHEYALQPSVLCSWAESSRDYAEFMREYGLGTPRLISSFPKRQSSRLRRYFLQYSPGDNQSLKALRYTEMVEKLVETLVLREPMENQPSDWAEAAVSENARAPFGVVISSMPLETERNITPDCMYDRGSAWSHPNQVDFQRTKADFLSIIENMIRLASQRIVIVDAYGWTNESIAMLQTILNSMHNSRVGGQVPPICVFYKEHSKGPSARYVLEQIVEGLNDDGKTVQLDVMELREIRGNDVFHNRCILTELAGIMIGHGIGVSDDPAHTDDATLMHRDIYVKKWRQFVDECCFEVVSHAKSN